MGDDAPTNPTDDGQRSDDVSTTENDDATPGVSERAEGAIDRLLQSPALSWLADDLRPLEERYNKTSETDQTGDAAADPDTGMTKSGDVATTETTPSASGATAEPEPAQDKVLPPGARLPRPAPELEPEPEPEPPKRRPRPEPDPPDVFDKVIDALIGSRMLRWAISLVAIAIGLPAVLGIWVVDPVNQQTHTLASDTAGDGSVIDVVQCWHSEKSMVYAVELHQTSPEGTRSFETLGYANQKVWAGAELNVVGDDAFVDFPDGPLWARESVSTQTSLTKLRPIDSTEPYPNICD